MRRVVMLASGVLLFAWLFTLRPVFLGGSASYIIVTGASMEPTLHSGDLVVVQRQADYEPGDVVAFRVPGGYVIHRIVGGSAQQGYLTQGDNRPALDPWKPTPDQIAGKMWAHLPGWGRVVAYLRQPMPLAFTLTAVALLCLPYGARTRRRRNGGRTMASARGREPARPLPGPTWAVLAMGLFALLAAILGAVGGYAFRLPAERQDYVERLSYRHVGSFDYAVLGPPSTLYPDGVVGPVLPPSRADVRVSAPPIYTKLVDRMTIGFSYALESPLPPQVAGELSAAFEIKAGDTGWTRRQELLRPTAFSGPNGSSRLSVDLASVSSLLDAIEKETGFSPGSYTFSVLPTVRISGRIGTEEIDDTFSPTFVIKFNRTQIVPDAELVRAETRSVGETVARQQWIGAAGLLAPVAALRLWGVGGAVVCLGIAGGLAAYLFLGLGRGEAGRIQARYSSLLIPAAKADFNPGTEWVYLDSLHDLARIARRDGQVIFRQEVAPGSYRYFMHQGDVVYGYVSGQAQDRGQVDGQ